jgi:ATP-dependent helicase HrpA
VHPRAYPDLAGDLAALLPADFLAATPFPQLANLPRYLQAMKLRADRWKENPARDAEREKRLAPYLKAVGALRASSAGSGEAHLPFIGHAGDSPKAAQASRPALPTIGGWPHAKERFRWLVEEYRVSLFAQELGTAEAVSTVKLDRELAALRRPAPADARGGEISGKSADRLPAPAAIPTPAKVPLKSLGALDRLFPKV